MGMLTGLYVLFCWIKNQNKAYKYLPIQTLLMVSFKQILIHIASSIITPNKDFLYARKKCCVVLSYIVVSLQVFANIALCVTEHITASALLTQHRKEHDIYVPRLTDHVEPCTLHLASIFSHVLCHHKLSALLRLHHYRKSELPKDPVSNTVTQPRTS
jgi:hypothetical protein